jgi:hypothetical protein
MVSLTISNTDYDSLLLTIAHPLPQKSKIALHRYGYHTTLVTSDEIMGLVLMVPLVVAFQVKQLHHSIPIQVSYLYWSFQPGPQLYDPSILSHFFLNHHSEKPKQVSCQNPPQLIHKEWVTVNLHKIKSSKHRYISFRKTAYQVNK